MSPDPLDQPPWVRKFFGYLPGWRVSLLSFYSTVVFKVGPEPASTGYVLCCSSHRIDERSKSFDITRLCQKKRAI